MNKTTTLRVAFIILLVLFVSLTYVYLNVIFGILAVVSGLIEIGSFLYHNNKEENKGYHPQPSYPQEYQPRGQTLSDNQFVITGSSNVVNINSEKKQEEEETETD